MFSTYTCRAIGGATTRACMRALVGWPPLRSLARSSSRTCTTRATPPQPSTRYARNTLCLDRAPTDPGRSSGLKPRAGNRHVLFTHARAGLALDRRTSSSSRPTAGSSGAALRASSARGLRPSPCAAARSRAVRGSHRPWLGARGSRGSHRSTGRTLHSRARPSKGSSTLPR